MTAATTETRTSVCDQCDGPIEISIVLGEQRWHDVEWKRVSASDDTHPVQPELRFAIDATCPGCDFPEVGFSPARGEFICSRCTWVGNERPAS